MQAPSVAALQISAGRSLLYYNSRRKGDFSPCPATSQPMTNQHTQPMRNQHNPGLSFPPINLSSKQLLLTSSFPLEKHALSFVLLTCLCFTMVCMSRITIPLLSLEKLIFVGKIIDKFYKGFRYMAQQMGSTSGCF